MGELLLGVCEQLLKLGNLAMEEKHRYDDDILKLKKEWYEEFARVESGIGSDDSLDRIEQRVRLTTEALLTAVRTKNP